MVMKALAQTKGIHTAAIRVKVTLIIGIKKFTSRSEGSE